MTVKQLRNWLLELPEALDNVEIVTVKTYPDDAAVKGIQQPVYKQQNNTIYLILK